MSVIDKQDWLHFGDHEFRGETIFKGKVSGLVIDPSELDITPEDIGAATEEQGALAESAIQSVTAGDNITIDNTDPNNPIISSSGGGAVASVNGQVGAVTLTASDVEALPNTYTPPAQSWNIITDKPDTFAPIIGTTATTAAAGNHTHGAATTSANGFMASADKTKLDGVAAGATVGATWGTNITNQPAVIAAGTDAVSAFVQIRDGALEASGGLNGGSGRAARGDHSHASINGWPTNTTAALTVASGAATVNLSQRMNWYADITANLVLTLQNMVIRTPYTIDIVNTDTVQHTVSIDGVPYTGNQDFSIPPNGGAAIINIIQLTATRPIYATIAIKQAP